VRSRSIRAGERLLRFIRGALSQQHSIRKRRFSCHLFRSTTCCS
jgi:hypothetical protein